jgi:uncharacterized protein (DUF433 family)
MGRLLTFPAPSASQPDHLKETGFYRPADAARIARIPRQRLTAWQHEGIVVPRLKIQVDDEPAEWGYTFTEVVYLRLIRMLREHNIALEEAVKAVKHLEARWGPPGPAWGDVRIFTQGRHVYVEGKDEWEVTDATEGGQKVATTLFGEEFARLRDRADALLVPVQFRPFVEIDPSVRSGLPVVRGTTIETSVLYGLHEQGHSYQNIHEYYPIVSLAKIKGAIKYEDFLEAEAA